MTTRFRGGGFHERCSQKSYKVEIRESIIKQLIIVLTKNFSSVNGELFAFDENQENPSLTFSVVVGKKGMAWGRGIHSYWLLPGKHKTEGDEKAPAGLFTLSSLFGQEHPKQTNMPFLAVSNTHFCVDDPSSQFYNVIVNEKEVEKDWSSAEEMHRADGLYEQGVVIDHNADPVTPNMGSCIFMHQWRSSDRGTAGCTAMSQINMRKLVEWLDIHCEPHLVQIPKEGYSAFLSSLRVETSKEIVTKRLGKLINA